MKWLLRIFAGVLLIVTIAWLSFPWWAGSMVSLFVPQGWKLESAEFHRPVFSKQEISLELADPGGGEIELKQYRDAGMHTELTAVLDLARVDPVLWEAALKSLVCLQQYHPDGCRKCLPEQGGGESVKCP